MKIFAYHNGDGVTKWRIMQPYKYLPEYGIDVTMPPDRMDRVSWNGIDGPCSIPNIPSHQGIAGQYDAIVSSYKGNEADCFRLWYQAQHKPLIIDIDDDVDSLPTDNPVYPVWHKFDGMQDKIEEIPEGDDLEEWKKKGEEIGAVVIQSPATGKWCLYQPLRNAAEIVKDQIKFADLVTVSTKALYDKYSKINPNTVIIPNAIDWDWWPQVKKPTDGRIRLGLFGSNSHYRDWKTIIDPLKRILAEFPQVTLCFNSWFRKYPKPDGTFETRLLMPDFFEEAGFIFPKEDESGWDFHPQVECFQGVEIWEYPKWLADKGVDIGLAPLADTTFNKSKSNLKYLEYGAIHTPCVFQNAEPYADDIKHGFNGMLAGKPNDWYVAIKRLIQDEKLRLGMGYAAHLDVKTRYSQEIISSRLAEAIKSTVERKKNEKAVA